MPKSLFSETGTGCIHYGQIYTYYNISTKNTLSFIPDEAAQRLTKVDHGDIIITNTSENLEDVCKAVAWLGDKQIVTGGHATVIKHSQNPKYLSYYFHTEEFQTKKKKYVTGTKVMDISAKNLAKLPIPLPPLAIQKKIVDILDQFFTLEAQLEAELKARTKQYHYYRNALLNFEKDTITQHPLHHLLTQLCPKGVEVKTLLELCDTYQPKTIGKRDLIKDGAYPVFGANGIIGHYNRYNHEHSEIILGCRGSCGAVHITPPKTWITGNAMVIHPKDDRLNQRFLFHLLKNINFSKIITGSAQPQITRNALSSLKIPLPPLEIQEKIVSILDRFNALVYDISIGLPAEITARKKQYHYYRDNLLNFEHYQRE